MYMNACSNKKIIRGIIISLRFFAAFWFPGSYGWEFMRDSKCVSIVATISAGVIEGYICLMSAAIDISTVLFVIL